MSPKDDFNYGTRYNRARFTRLALIAGSVALMGVATLGSAHAGTQGTEFDTVYTTIVGWAQGTLGKIIALAMFVTGAAVGVVRQSLLAAVPAIGGALALYAAPTVIGNIMTATIHGTSHVLPAAVSLGLMN